MRDLTRITAWLHAESVVWVQSVPDASVQVVTSVNVVVMHVAVAKLHATEKILGTIWTYEDSPIMALNTSCPPMLQAFQACLGDMLASCCGWS